MSKRPSKGGAAAALVAESPAVDDPVAKATAANKGLAQAPVAWTWSRLPYRWQILSFALAALLRCGPAPFPSPSPCARWCFHCMYKGLGGRDARCSTGNAASRVATSPFGIWLFDAGRVRPGLFAVSACTREQQ